MKKEVLICQDKLGYEGGNFILEKGIRLKGLKEHWIGNRDKSFLAIYKKNDENVNDMNRHIILNTMT